MPGTNSKIETIDARQTWTLPTGSVAFRLSVCLLLLVSYLPVFALYARQHWDAMNLQGAYAHAPLTLALIAWLVWRQRENLSLNKTTAEDIKVTALFTLSAGVLLKAYGDVQGYVVLQGASIIPVLLGLSYIYFDSASARRLRFPILMLAFVVPLPSAAIDAITQPLISITADAVTGLLPLFQIDVLREGFLLTVNRSGEESLHQVIMAPECSGIRSLVALLALGCLLTYIMGRSRIHSLLLLLLILPMVLLGNSLRVLSTILMIIFVSPETAENYFHWSSGLLLFAFTLVGLILADALLMRLRSPGRQAS